MKKIILIIIIAVVLGIGIYYLFIKDEKPTFVLEKVSKGTVVKEVSETGIVKISEERNLGFKNTGKIEKIYVEVGDMVKAGQKLAQLNNSQLFIQLEEAQAGFGVAEAKKIDVQLSLKNAKQDLENIEADAEEDLKNAYQDALNTLDNCYLKIYDASTVAKLIHRTYFTSNDQEGINIRNNRDKIEGALNQAKSYIEEAKNDSQDEKIDTALSEVKDALEDITNALEVIRDIAEKPVYRDTISGSDKTSLDNQKSYIITAHTNIVNIQQTISTTKVTNTANINTAKAEISTLETKLQENGLYQAQINQAQAQVSLLQNQIQESILKSPNKGQITKVNKREGEIVQPTESLISFFPSGPFQIKVDIYEEDIVDVKVSNSVDITLVAFPEQVLKGKVASINPAEKLMEGVVYYEITIDLALMPEGGAKEGIKPGMTADIVIETDKKGNVLVISENALEKINGKKIVKVFKEGEIKEREIEIGLEGSNDLIEVISGLNEGEEIVID